MILEEVFLKKAIAERQSKILVDLSNDTVVLLRDYAIYKYIIKYMHLIIFNI